MKKIKQIINEKNADFIALLLIILVVGGVLNMSVYTMLGAHSYGHMNTARDHSDEMIYNMEINEAREMFIEMKETIIIEMLAQGDYACCLIKPCTYCIEKTPGHGDGAKCSCLDDIMNGVHPCGECIGEILEGHGNRFIAKYFARAIAEKVGENHLSELQKIIFEKYDVVVSDQL